MGLDEPDHDIGPTLETPPTLVEHGTCLAHAGGRSQVHAEAAGGTNLVWIGCFRRLMSWIARLTRSVEAVGTLGRRELIPGKDVTDAMRSMHALNRAQWRVVLGAVVAIAGQVALVAVMVPLRAHLSVATPPLVFVVPVVIGVVVGGFVPGAIAAVSGFLFYDIFFIPPYGTLTVRGTQNWVALVVYVIVVLVVTRVVTTQQALGRTPSAGSGTPIGSSSSPRP